MNVHIYIYRERERDFSYKLPMYHVNTCRTHNNVFRKHGRAKKQRCPRNGFIKKVYTKVIL